MDAPFREAVQDGLTQYFDANWGTSTTRRCDCEAMKVVIRGLCMQTTYGVRRQLEKDVLDHKAKLSDLDKMPSTATAENGRMAADSTVVTRRLERYVYKAYRQRLHAEGDKASAFLLRMFKQHADRMPVTALVDVTGRTVCTQVAVNTVFRDPLDKLCA
ncbi:hypothetical protein NDU88_004517 [Pleurodeles waltl]|uniref:Uncharacterized protein n=1 Tax=Pleurodeles waltl TaxID=8319 RepID=A0AAV7V3N8_PLEWA|nr:hypothetical protein NDU88_004517 [Pleurodeles waltl]